MIAQFTCTSADLLDQLLVAYFLKKAQSGEGGKMERKNLSLKQDSVSHCHF
jgi:hypothetical protein